MIAWSYDPPAAFADPLSCQPLMVGERVQLSDLGKKNLLPWWKNQTETGTVVEIISPIGGYVIRVQRDGVTSNGPSFAGYWERE